MVRSCFLMWLPRISCWLRLSITQIGIIAAWIHHGTRYGNTSTIINWNKVKVLCFRQPRRNSPLHARPVNLANIWPSCLAVEGAFPSYSWQLNYVRLSNSLFRFLVVPHFWWHFFLVTVLLFQLDQLKHLMPSKVLKLAFWAFQTICSLTMGW